jgi:hypothetical protein
MYYRIYILHQTFSTFSRPEAPFTPCYRLVSRPLHVLTFSDKSFLVWDFVARGVFHAKVAGLTPNPNLEAQSPDCISSWSRVAPSYTPRHWVAQLPREGHFPYTQICAPNGAVKPLQFIKKTTKLDSNCKQVHTVQESSFTKPAIRRTGETAFAAVIFHYQVNSCCSDSHESLHVFTGMKRHSSWFHVLN